MSPNLTPRDIAELRHLAQSTVPLWGGVLERGGDVDTMRWEQMGLIEKVFHPVTVGKSKFRGGYMITAAGRVAIGATIRV